MKHLLFVAVLAMFTTPYNNITEEIFLNEDGSGKYNVYTNKVPTMKAVLMEQLRLTKKFNGDEQTLAQLAAAKLWEDNSENFSYSTAATQNASEAVLNDPAKKSILENIINFTVGNKKKNTIHTGLMCKFKNLEELNQLMALTRMDPLRDFKTLDLSKTKDRLSIGRNKIAYKAAKDSAEHKAALPTNIGTFKTILYLPKKIKKVKSKGTKTRNGQMLTLEYPLAEVLAGNVSTDFEIKWKK